MTRFLLPMVLFAGLLVVFAVGLTKDPSRLPSPLIGKTAPVFALPSVEEPARKITSDEFKGRYYLVNVWASWCFACRDEHDFLLDLAARKEIPIVGLNWRDPRPDALRWLGELGNPYSANAHDLDGRIGIEFGVYGAPETFLIDPVGNVLAKHVSPMTEDIWQKQFKPLMQPLTP